MNSPVHMATAEQIPGLPGDEGQSFSPPGTPHQDGYAMFELEARRLPDGTYENIEIVKILTPGDPKSVPCHKVTDYIRQKYRAQYEAFRRGMEESPAGVPLEMFPTLTPAQIRELKANNVFTVEQLANVADANLHRIMMGQDLKQKAQAWIKVKQETDAVEKNRLENQALRDGQKQLEEQVAALTRALEARNTKDDEAAPVMAPPPPAPQTAPDPMPQLRAEYHALAGKKPFGGWDEATLRDKIATMRFSIVKQEG